MNNNTKVNHLINHISISITISAMIYFSLYSASIILIHMVRQHFFLGSGVRGVRKTVE